MQPTILITRPGPAAAALARVLRTRLGADAGIVTAPLMQIEPVGAPVTPNPAARLIFTSVNGVASVAAGALSGRVAYAVGPATAAAVRAAGGVAVECGGTAEALLARILEDRPEGALLHLRGEHARGDVAGRLRAAGFDAQELVTYRQVARPLSEEARLLLDGTAPVILPLFSPRSARLLARAGRGCAPLQAVAISRAAAEEARALAGAEITIAPEPNQQAMVEAVAAIWRGGSARDQLERIAPRQ